MSRKSTNIPESTAPGTDPEMIGGKAAPLVRKILPGMTRGAAIKNRKISRLLSSASFHFLDLANNPNRNQNRNLLRKKDGSTSPCPSKPNAFSLAISTTRFRNPNSTNYFLRREKSPRRKSSPIVKQSDPKASAS